MNETLVVIIPVDSSKYDVFENRGTEKEKLIHRGNFGDLVGGESRNFRILKMRCDAPIELLVNGTRHFSGALPFEADEGSTFADPKAEFQETLGPRPVPISWSDVVSVSILGVSLRESTTLMLDVISEPV